MQKFLNSWPPVFPLLFSVFSVLALYQSNSYLLPSMRVIVEPILVVSIIVTIVTLVLGFILRNYNKASIIIVVPIIFILLYGYLKKVLPTVNDWIIVVVFAVVFSGWILLVMKRFTAVGSKRLVVFADVISVCLVISSIVAIGVTRPTQGLAIKEDLNSEINWTQVSTKPDIYYLIFDEYTGEEVLRNYYKYDNTGFLDSLREAGFYIEKNAFSNYPVTSLSIPSSLNMGYLDTTVVGALEAEEYPGFYKSMQDYKVWRILKDGGYKFVSVGSWWPPTSVNTYADLNYSYTDSGFSSLVLNTSLLGQILDSPDLRKGEVTVQALTDLKVVPTIDGPKFVFAHIILPHKPNIFTPEGEIISPEVEATQNYDKGYINNLKYASREILTIINKIKEVNKDSVIIIQGDTGPTSIWGYGLYSSENGGSLVGLDKAHPEWIWLKMNILNALYLPGAPKPTLEKFDTPVNTFRLIFNYYFGSNYSILPERHYFMEAITPPFGFMEVSDAIEKGKEYKW